MPTRSTGEILGTTRRVLVVDDEAPVRALTQEILRSMGFGVVLAEHGAAALSIIEAGAEEDESFDLIISDLRMPTMDGARLYREMERRWPRMAERILFITGDIEGERTSEKLDPERIHYLEKPFTTRQLRAAIEEILGPLER